MRSFLWLQAGKREHACEISDNFDLRFTVVSWRMDYDFADQVSNPFTAFDRIFAVYFLLQTGEAGMVNFRDVQVSSGNSGEPAASAASNASYSVVSLVSFAWRAAFRPPSAIASTIWSIFRPAAARARARDVAEDASSDAILYHSAVNPVAKSATSLGCIRFLLRA